MRLKFEPTLVLQTLAALLTFMVTFGLPFLNAEQAGAIVAVLAAFIGVYNAVKVRPIAPAAFQALITVGVALLSTYGLHFSQQGIGALQVLVVAVIAMLTRGQVSPAVQSAVRARL